MRGVSSPWERFSVVGLVIVRSVPKKDPCQSSTDRFDKWAGQPYLSLKLLTGPQICMTNLFRSVETNRWSYIRNAWCTALQEEISKHPQKMDCALALAKTLAI